MPSGVLLAPGPHKLHSCSSIHDHSNSHCFMKVLAGDLLETLYDWPEEGEQQQSRAMKVTAQHSYSRDQVTYISGEHWSKPARAAHKMYALYINCAFPDEIGLHRVENSSHSEPAVSLHLYSPPFGTCQTFDERSGMRNVCRVVFHSKCGSRCPPL